MARLLLLSNLTVVPCHLTIFCKRFGQGPYTGLQYLGLIPSGPDVCLFSFSLVNFSSNFFIHGFELIMCIPNILLILITINLLSIIIIQIPFIWGHAWNRDRNCLLGNHSAGVRHGALEVYYYNYNFACQISLFCENIIITH